MKTNRKTTLFLVFSMVCFISSGISMPGMGGAMSQSKPEKPESVDPGAFYYGWLDNGMEVALVPNHSVGMISANIIVKAGARDESWQTWGAAHFLEHMLFNGTVSRTQEEIYEEFDLIGAYHNAHTGSHFTDFIVLAPKNHFLEGLEILSEMVFASTLPKEKFEKERGIVMEEIAMTRSRYPDYDLPNRKALYGTGSLSRSVLGTVESIARLDRDSVLAYYQTWYVPNNSFLFITGDFAADTLKASLDSLLKRYEPVNVPPRKTIEPPDYKLMSAKGLQKIPSTDSSYKLFVSYPAPHPSSPDFPAYRVYLKMLESRLSEGLPSEVRAVSSVMHDLDFSVLTVELTSSSPGYSGERLLEEFDAQISELGKYPYHNEKLERIARKMKADEVFTSENLHYYGIMNSPYWSLIPWYEFNTWFDRIESLKSSAIRDIDKKWMDEDCRVALLMDPDYQPEEKKSDEITAAQTGFLVDRHDGDGVPTTIVRADPTANVFAMHILVKDRWLWDRQYTPGTVDLLHRLIVEGTDRRGLSVSDRLDEIGANLKTYDYGYIPYDDYYTTPEYSYIRFECLPEFWEKGVEIVFDLMAEPPEDSKSLENAKSSAAAASGRDTMSPVKAGRDDLHGKLLPGTSFDAEVYGDVSAVTFEQLSSLRKSCFHPDNLIITVSGPVPGKTVKDAIQAKLKDLADPDFQFKAPAGEEQITAHETLFTDTLALGKPQGAYLRGSVLPEIANEDQAALIVANSWLNERLSFVIREEKGMAYSLGSSFAFRSMDEDRSWMFWEIAVGTRPENLIEAQSTVEEILTDLRNHKFTEKELQRITNSIAGRQMMRSMPRAGQAFAMGLGEFFWNDPKRREHFIDQLNEIEPIDVEAAVLKYLHSVVSSEVFVR